MPKLVPKAKAAEFSISFWLLPAKVLKSTITLHLHLLFVTSILMMKWVLQTSHTSNQSHRFSTYSVKRNKNSVEVSNFHLAHSSLKRLIWSSPHLEKNMVMLFDFEKELMMGNPNSFFFPSVKCGWHFKVASCGVKRIKVAPTIHSTSRQNLAVTIQNTFLMASWARALDHLIQCEHSETEGQEKNFHEATFHGILWNLSFCFVPR